MTGAARAHSARLERAPLHRIRDTHSYWAVLGAIFVAFFLAALLPDAPWATSVVVLVLCATLMIAIWTAGWGRGPALRVRPVSPAAAAAAATVNFFTQGESTDRAARRNRRAADGRHRRGHRGRRNRAGEVNSRSVASAISI
jgi:hypothetical protein